MNETTNPQTVVLVGHCGPDMFVLRNAVSSFVPQAEIEVVNDAASLQPHLHSNSLLLVNRVLDGSFETESGVGLISDLTAEDRGVKAMLISNYQDAQHEAEAAGALPGFGKKQVYESGTGELIRAAFEDGAPASD